MAKNEPIAIVGSGCRFAGDIDSPSRLWELLREPRDICQEIPASRFSVEGFYHPNGAYHGHSNVRHAYVMHSDPSRFDTEFFGIKPSEAKSMDPQQRLLLEVVYEAIEAAGMTIAGLGGSDTAVYAGLMTNDYGMMLTRDLAHVPTYHATGISSAIVSNRISYFFDWHGPSMTVDTGCSASLVALHLAVQSLRNGESRMALACGTNLILGPEYFVIESKLKMLSPDGRSKMWDQEANGYARGDGVTAVVLKTLSAALADGDHIECIIRETGLNQDGSTPGITMPSAAAQEALIRSTYAKAGLDLRNPSDRPHYFEAHGTGTPAGDPIEAEAISMAFFRDGLDEGNNSGPLEKHPLYVGSFKTVLGHTEGSAGIAAILKASLALQNSTIPPNLLFNKLSDRVAPFYDNLEIVRQSRPWPKLAPGQPRRVSVNSFGFGGANAHAILESYTPPQAEAATIERPLFTPIVFSASSQKGLRAILASYADHLLGVPDVAIRNLAWTLRARRAVLPFRAAVGAVDAADAVAGIQALLQRDNAGLGAKALPPSRSGGVPHGILGIFTGQGAQYARMGAELVEHSPLARRIIKSLEMMLSELPVNDRPQWSLKEQILAAAATSRVHEAEISQPLCTAVQVMMVDLLRSAGVNFRAVVGHSSGEIAAAYAAGFLTAREAIYIAYYRGLHLEASASPRGPQVGGAMLAVGSSMARMTEVCASARFLGRVSVAASNSSSSVTISGDEDAIAELKDLLDTENTFNRRLKVDKAYHSAHMRPCSGPYVDSLMACVRERQSQDARSSCRWYSSVHDKAVDSAAGISPVYWAENMANPVLFSQALARASTEVDFEIAIEVGAHPALKGPASQTIGEELSSEKAIPYFGTLNRGSSAVGAFSSTLGQLWSLLGPGQINLDACEKAMSQDSSARFSVLKGLPSYPWDHSTSFWHEARASRHLRLRQKPVHSLLGDETPDSTLHHLSWRNLLRIKEMEWLSGHAIQGQVVFPAAGYMCSALEASRRLISDGTIRLIELVDFTIHQAVILPEDDAGVEVLIELVEVPASRPDCIQAKFTYSAAVGHDVETLTLAASATVILKRGTPSTSLLPPSSNGLKLAHATDVDTKSFYSALEDLGYNFGGRFCSLTQLTRKHRASLGFIQAEPLDSEALLIHPTELDAAFQAILLACSYPNDEQLRVLHLPTVIKLVRLNPALCRSRDSHSAQLLPIEGTIVPGADGEIGLVGDVNVFSASSPNAMIQVQGAKLVPFGGAAAAKDDRNMFSTTHWIPKELDPSNYTPLDQHMHGAMGAMERISAFYLRRLDRQLPADHPLRSERPLSFYLNYARHVTNLVDSGQHGMADDSWKDDTLESVTEASREFSDVLDVRLMHLVGEHMPRALKGETTMMEELRRAHILGDYYTKGAVIQASASWIIGMMKQITERSPHLNILEIGAGGSGEAVTSRIPSAIGNGFLSYTYADVAGSVQPDGTAFFSQPNDPKPTRTFDWDLEANAQGYVEGHYDVVIAFWVMHATTDLESSLSNLRKLLRPGGYLIVAEGGHTGHGYDGGLTAIFGTLGGWWLGADQGRTLTPYLTIPEWDDVLKSTGFSGVDLTAPKQLVDTFGTALFVSQAVDEQVSFLRDPVAALPPASPLIADLVVVGGTSTRSAHLAEGLDGMFSPMGTKTHRFGRLEEVDFSIISPQTTVVSLTELDEPVFCNMTDRRFAALKQMFGHGKKLMWVTSGRLDHQPYSNLTLGFGRTAVVETPDLLLQQLDVADPRAIGARDVARALLRFVSTVPETVLWNVESEIMVDAQGNELVPRLKPVTAFNHRHNSAAREIKQLTNVDQSEVSLRRTDHGWTARLSVASFSSLLPDGCLELRTLHSTSTAIKTAVGHQFLILGRHEATQKTYVALVPSLASSYRLPTGCAIPYSGKAADLGLMAAQLVATAVLNTVSSGATAVAHNAVGALAIALKAQASFQGIHLVFTSDSTNTAAVGHKLTPYLTQYEVNRALPAGVALFVGLSTSDEHRETNETAMVSCLPRHCHKESAGSLFGREGLSSTVGTASVLRNAINKIDNYDAADLQRARSNSKSVDVSAILEGASTNDDPLETVDWTTSTALPVTVERADYQQTFSGGKTYWILGLSAAIGASVFDWIIQQGAKNLVFSSRRPQLDTSWIDTHRRNGVRIEVVACDLTDESALRRAHAEICAKFPPIAGVLNGAALFRDNSILNMSLEELNDCLRPKVLGTLHLDRMFHDIDLEFFILTSSITGLLGSAGQANYAAANTFMCGVAAQRRKRGLAATAVNLGAIAGLGLLERADKKVLESIMQRLSLMPVSEGDFHQILAEAIQAGRPDAVGCGPELTTALRAVPFDEPGVPAFFANPMLSHFRLVGMDRQKAKGSKANSTKELLAVCETKAELQNIITGAFSNELRKTLHTTASDEKLMEMRSSELGIDSLVSIDLRTWFTKNLKVNVPVLKIMGNDPTGDLVLFAVDHVPAELVPMMTDREVSGELMTNGDVKTALIDWDAETAPPADLLELAAKSTAATPRATVPRTVVLTGATGFLGSHILNALLEQPSVRAVHCLAVRKLEERLKRGELPLDDRVVYHAGELHQPRLGLSEEEAGRLFDEADAVIHNGADTSHLKSYWDLRPSNMDSTLELVRLCLPRRIPLHFVSSNAVGRYSNKPQIGEVAISSPGAPRPPTDGSSGYRSTKWAAETLLERVFEATRLPLWIHRPSTIIRTGKDAEGQAAQLDWMNALIWYMDKLSAVPKLNHGTGYLDLVHARTVCTGIAAHVFDGGAPAADHVVYAHHMADLLLPLAKLDDFSRGSDRQIRQLPRDEWTAEAVAAGMHPAVVVLLEMMDAPDLKGPPMFVKGPGSPAEPTVD